jgi:hypothetical protein
MREANVTLHVASPQRVDSLEIEDGSGTELAICTSPLPVAPRTDLFGAILPQTHTCPSAWEIPPESQSLRGIFIVCFISWIRGVFARDHPHARREDSARP